MSQVHLLMALLMGAAFYAVGADIAGFQNRAGSMHYLLTFFSLSGLSTAGTLTREWSLLWVERHAGLYHLLPYCLTRLAIELLLLRVLPAVAFGGVFYAMMGLKADAAAFAQFELAAALASVDAALLCAAVAACAPHRPGATSLVATVLLLVCLLLSGFQINLRGLEQTGLAPLAELSFARHAFEVMLVNELSGALVAIDVPGAPRVRVKSEVILGALGLSARRIPTDLGALVLIGAALLVLSTAIVSAQMWRHRRGSWRRRRPSARLGRVPGRHTAPEAADVQQAL